MPLSPDSAVESVVRFHQPHLRTHRRRLANGSVLPFFSHPTSSTTVLQVDVAAGAASGAWLDPWQGKAYRADLDAARRASISLPAYGAIYLLLEAVPGLVSRPHWRDVARTEIRQWQVTDTHGTRLYEGPPPRDWRQHSALADLSGPLKFHGVVEAPKPSVNGRIELDLTGLAGAADARLNGNPVGVVLRPPYRLDLTEWMQPGTNQLDIVLYVSRKNRIAAAIARGEAGWNAPDLGFDVDTVAVGLLGPVSIISMELGDSTALAKDRNARQTCGQGCPEVRDDTCAATPGRPALRVMPTVACAALPRITIFNRSDNQN
ncbi:MAG: hypothetical protein HRT77_15860 [Halioglobus sp.]|nr:hypothetical protein [Halioglobus sp.]